jgi:peptidoglycan/xylan/chitin deacetylase (PgdA/CDA1 family)
MSRPLAVVSVDVDPVDLHLSGYGFKNVARDPLAYTTSLPRLAEVFARTGVRSTLFVVARDAEAHAEDLRRALQAGHEIASHSMSHPLPLTNLPEDRLRTELADSRHALRAATGAEILGFRAPNWDISTRVLEGLAAAGYRYDASILPTMLLLPGRLLIALKSSDPAILKMPPWPMALGRMPHVRTTRSGSIAELPVSVTPGLLRFPVYHTVHYMLSMARFRRQLDGFVRRGEPLFYPLHAVDALGLQEDHIDPRLKTHPGMNLALEAKLELLQASLSAIAERFEPVTYEEYLRRTPLGV